MAAVTTSNQQNKMDMLHGPLVMKILYFALPLAASSAFQQLFNSVDVAVVGRFASSEALAAVGSNAPVISLLINLFLGISMGANAVISNHIGQNNASSIRHAVHTVGLVALISGILLFFVGILLARPILSWMDTPANVLDMAVRYLRIYFVGIPFFMIFNFGSAILRSQGDTKRPLYILLIAGVVNTLLNLLFVIGLGMGVSGVAVATAIANALSALLIVRILRKEEEPFRLHLDQLRIDSNELKRMLQIGVPAGVQGVIFSISNVIIQSTINSYGSNAIAGSAAALNFEMYCYFLVVAFNGAAISFVGQNYGAGYLDRVKRIFWICLLFAFLFCAGFNLFFAWQGEFFLSLFTVDKEVITYGLTRMHIVLVVQWIACSYEISGAVMRGMGHSIKPTVLTIVGTCLLRIVWVYAVCPRCPGFDILLMAYPVSWILTGSIVYIAYMRLLNQTRRNE